MAKIKKVKKSRMISRDVFVNAGKKGGATTLKRHGKEHFSKIRAKEPNESE